MRRKFAEDQALENRLYRVDEARIKVKEAEMLVQGAKEQLSQTQKQLGDAESKLAVAQKACESDRPKLWEWMEHLNSCTLPTYP